MSLIDVATPRRSLNLHSCAGGSPLAPGCCSAGCVDCHYGNGGVHGGGGDGSDGWGVLCWCSKESATPEDDFIEQIFRQRAGLRAGEQNYSDAANWILRRRSLIRTCRHTCSKGRWLVAAPSAPLLLLGPCPVLPACSEEGARLRLERCRKRATRPRVT